MVLKAAKMRIYPNSAQRNQLWQTFGCVRFVWRSEEHTSELQSR